jgi:uncharacterized membrane protein YqjE
MGIGRKNGGRSRQESPQEAWERMRRAGAPESTAPAPAQPSVRAEPSAPARSSAPAQPTAPAPAQPPERAPAPTPSPVATAPPPVPPPPQSSPGQEQEPSVSDLVKQLSEQTSTLVKQEMQLAQAELKEKGKKAGMGAGLFGAGGLVGFFGAAVLIAAIVLALSTVVDAWLSALIVGVVLLLAAGVAALLGKKQVEKATPPAPEQAIGSVKRDVQTVKEHARR